MLRSTRVVNGVRRFADEWELEREFEDPEEPPVQWRDGSYRYRDEPPQDPPRRAHNIIADSLRTYCDEHLEVHKRDLEKLLGPGNLLGPLCICSPLRIFIGQWWCINCFHRDNIETQTEKRRRVRESEFQECAEDGCERRVDQQWKQCSICKHLKELYVPEG
jgi:hypothetical protein